MKQLLILLGAGICLSAFSPQVKDEFAWKHLSSTSGDMEAPNSGNQQTATALFDVDKDGLNDFFIAERSQAPSVILYMREAGCWERHIVDAEPLRIEAGSAFCDIDGDGDLDVVFGGDGGTSQVWWWENPCPDFNPRVPWKRRLIKNSGANKHHDQLFGDFNGDGREELVFWNQNARTLFRAEIPEDVKEVDVWNLQSIYTYSDETEPQQRGTYPGWKNVNEHEGLAKIDIDGDGKLDIVGGGRWFKHIEGSTFEVNVIDDTYAFSRSAAGDFVTGGRPEVFLVVGDGRAPLIMYEWKTNRWAPRIIIEEVQDGHSIEVLDFNGDGHLDLFMAEMRLGAYENPVTRILLGDGKGGFRVHTVHIGFGLHESRIADLDGDGDYDILGKPYTWGAPRLDIWIQE